MFKGKAQWARFQCMPKDEHTRTPASEINRYSPVALAAAGV